MGEEITFQEITGEPVSGRFEVSEGLITVTLPDGRKTTADIEEHAQPGDLSEGALIADASGETAERDQRRFA